MIFRTNSFFVQFVLYVLILLVLPLCLRVLALFSSLLVLLLVLSLRTLLVSFCAMSFLMLTHHPPPLLLLLLALLPLLLHLLRRGLIVYVGLRLRGRLRVMLHCRPSWSSSSFFTSFYLSDIQFSSSLGFSLGPVVAAGSVVSVFLAVLSFCSLVVPSLTAGSVYPSGGGCSLFVAFHVFLRCVDGVRVWHFVAQWSPGLANSL